MGVDQGADPHRGLTRRRLLASGAVALGAAYAPPFARGASLLGLASPHAFPRDIPIGRTTFENWAETIRVTGVWTCRPANAEQVARVVNWAHSQGWKVRPRGAMHGWSPFTVTRDTTRDSHVMLVDTSCLAALERTGADTVRAGAGVLLDDFHDFLDAHGLALTSIPATGAPTVGGALAIGAHGAALPAVGEHAAPSHGFGSMSNQVVELEAIVWDEARGRYEPRTFSRSEADTSALLVHLGRAFVVSAVLRAGPRQSIRCVSIVDVPASEMFASPGSRGRLFSNYVDQAGRVESIWFPFTDKPWLKVWSVAPRKPATSRAVSGPYNYPFSDHIPKPVADLASEIIRGRGDLTPRLGQTEYEFASAGLAATRSTDIWGAWKDTLRYIRASTLRLDESGLAVLCRRSDLQRVLHLYANKWVEILTRYAARNSYPLNGPLEMRACAVDDPAVSGIAGARVPTLAATSPRTDRPDWDTVVWANALTFAYTPDCFAAYRDLQDWVLSTFDGTWAGARIEWSKSWAFTRTAAYADPQTLRHTIPQLMSAGRAAHDDWAWAMGRLNALDPHRVYGNEFLDGFAR